MKKFISISVFIITFFLSAGIAYSDYLAIFACKMGAGVGEDVRSASLLFYDTILNRVRKLTSYAIITRENVFRILSARGIDPNECSESSCAVDCGRILFVDRFVTCNISRQGKTYYVYLNYYDTDTGNLLDSKRKSVKGGVGEVVKAIAELADELFRGEKIGKGEAQLYIVTKTPEVEFEVDEGEIRGKVVDKKIIYLSPGSHRIKFTKPGYQSLKEEFFAEAGRVKTIEVELHPEQRKRK